MFLCGWLALGKKPYQALLIGITLAVVVGAPPGICTALWRSGDVIFGSLLAMLFTGIWPQRAFLHWRSRWQITSPPSTASIRPGSPQSGGKTAAGKTSAKSA
jgi:uncharacterized membrane protein YccC